MDLVARVRAIPRPGETVTGLGFETTPGGKGANQAVAAARLGHPVKMVGKVGEDVFGQALLDNLSKADVGVWAVERADGPSGVAPILVADLGENSIVVVPGSNGKLDRSYVDNNAELIRGAGMVLLQLEVPMEAIERVLEICAETQVPVMLDPAPAAALPDSVWSRVAWLTPNETEAAFYLGGGGDAKSPANAESAAEQLLANGVKGVVLKRGAEGAFVADSSGRTEWVPAFKVEAVDTVGAGDCFNGAFAVALMEGNDPWAAARFASAAAAISVTRRGAQASMPTRDEVEAFLVQHKDDAK